MGGEGRGWEGMGWVRQRQQLPPLPDKLPLALALWGRADPLLLAAAQGRCLEQLVPKPPPAGHPHSLHRLWWTMPPSGASTIGHCTSRTGTPSMSRPSASGDTSSTTGQSQSQKQGGSRGGGRAASHSASPLSVRWHSFHGNLLRYQRQLEGALEIHTLSLQLDAVTEQIGEKVSGERANAARQ